MAAREISRRVIPALKVEVVTLEDDFGAQHVVQQPMILEGLEAHDYDANERSGNILLDWHEATIENEACMLESNEAKFVAFAQRRGHNVESLKKKRPAGADDAAVARARAEAQARLGDVEGYKGCCG